MPETAPVDRRAHWEGVYRAREEGQLSWHQDDPRVSLELIRELCPAGAAVIDIGGGTSLLAGRLADAGYVDATVVDISDAAIRRAQARSGESARKVRWIVADVTSMSPRGTFDLWHDRAVFHFLTDPADRRRYVERAIATVRPGGHAVIATFAPEGPEQCSGLPVQRHDAASLAREFAAGFALVRTLRETHVTPWGKPQPFTWAVLQRLPAAP